MTLTELESNNQSVFDEMCLMLDSGRQSVSRDYERLAARYKKIPEKVRNILRFELYRGESPSKMLMLCLQTRYPNLPLRHFVWTLKKIGRKDIAEKLKPYVKTREEWFRSNSAYQNES